MKTCLIILSLVVHAAVANAQDALQKFRTLSVDGESRMIVNGDDIVLVINGASADYLYNHLNLKAQQVDLFNSRKAGKHITCTLNQDESHCELTLTQDPSGNLSGEVSVNN